MFEKDITEQFLKNLSVLEIKQKIFQLGCRKQYDTQIMEKLIKELERRQLEKRKT